MKRLNCGSILVCGIVLALSISACTTFPRSSPYPADISGRVSITDSILVQGGPKTLDAPTDRGIVYWVVEVSVRNKSYAEAVIASPSHWKIEVGDTTYNVHGSLPDISSSQFMEVPTGETGETIIRFAVPDSIKVEDATLCYMGQEPYSYCMLNGGAKVVAYDWVAKKAIGEEPPSAVLSAGSETTILFISPRNEDGYISPNVSYGCSQCGYTMSSLSAKEPWHFQCPECGTALSEAVNDVPHIEFVVSIKPLSIELNKLYYLVLLSRSGYLYGQNPLMWTNDDFPVVDPNERNITKMREADTKSTRLVTFRVDANDKEIEPLWREFNSLYTECREEAYKHGELHWDVAGGWDAGSFEPSEAEINRLCNKYVEVRLFTAEELALLKTTTQIAN